MNKHNSITINLLVLLGAALLLASALFFIRFEINFNSFLSNTALLSALISFLLVFIIGRVWGTSEITNDLFAYSSGIGSWKLKLFTIVTFRYERDYFFGYYKKQYIVIPTNNLQKKIRLKYWISNIILLICFLILVIFESKIDLSYPRLSKTNLILYMITQSIAFYFASLNGEAQVLSKIFTSKDPQIFRRMQNLSYVIIQQNLFMYAREMI